MSFAIVHGFNKVCCRLWLINQGWGLMQMGCLIGTFPVIVGTHFKDGIF